ncbi:MAG: ABC transporter permease [Actinomycetota bacterium]|nr:ABC transporter permease [Actinomycetota bacterium]
MTMTPTAPPQQPPPPEPIPPIKIKGQRSIAWTRRKLALKRFWAVYRRNAMGMAGLIILVIIVVLALIAPLIVDPTDLDPALAQGIPFSPPSTEHFLGTDNFGRDVFAMVIFGARISLLVGLAATLVTMVIGAGVGIYGGYYGGRIDSVLNAFTNWFLVIPWIALAIVLTSLLGPSLFNIIMVIGITSWAGTARLVRAQALSVRERPYVERSNALGASNWHMITRHILPNVFPVIFANTVLTVALSILSETTLALLGLGDPNSISWGTIINESFEAGALSAGYWWWLIPPGIAIVLVTLSFTMCGFALDEVMNPRLRKR